MLSAIVLLNTERDKTNKVAETLADLDGVSEVYSVAGRYDLRRSCAPATTISSPRSSPNGFAPCRASQVPKR